MSAKVQVQRFYLRNNEHTYWTLPVDSNTTAKYVCDAISSKLELTPGSCTLFETKTDKTTTWGIVRMLSLCYASYLFEYA